MTTASFDNEIATCEQELREAQEAVAQKLRDLGEARERKEAAVKAAAMGGQPEVSNGSSTTLLLDAQRHNLLAFIDEEPSRYALENLCYRPDMHAIVATNGRVLAVAKVDGGHYREPLMIPADMFARIAKVAKGSQISLTIDGAKASLATDEIAATFKPPEGRFPKTEDVIPQKPFDWHLTLDARYLLAIAKHACKILKDEDIGEMVLSFRTGENDRGQIDSMVRFELKGHDGEAVMYFVMPRVNG